MMMSLTNSHLPSLKTSECFTKANKATLSCLHFSFSWKLYWVKRWGSLFIEVNLLQKITQRHDLHARVRVFIFQESLQHGDLYKYTCKSDDYLVSFESVWLTWGLEHLTWMGCRSTWRQTTKECLPSELLCSLWDVTASVEVQPIGSSRLRLLCCPSNVYTLNWLRLTVQGKASPGDRHERRGEKKDSEKKKRRK